MTPGPKTRRSAETVGGAAAIVAAWLLSLTGVSVPDHVLQAFTILFMVVAARVGDHDA